MRLINNYPIIQFMVSSWPCRQWNVEVFLLQIQMDGGDAYRGPSTLPPPEGSVQIFGGKLERKLPEECNATLSLTRIPPGGQQHR